MNKCFILCAGLSDPFPDLVCPPVNGSGNVCVPMNLRKGTWDSFHHLCLVLKNNCSFVAINIQPWNIFQRILCQFSSIQSLSHVRLFSTQRNAAWQASLSITNSGSLLKLMSIESVMPSSHLILYCPLLLSPWIFPNIRVFSNESVLHVAKVLEFQLQHQSFQWTSRTDFHWDELVGYPSSLRDYQESSPTPQFKGINSSVLSFLHSPTLASINDYWKNHSLD